MNNIIKEYDLKLLLRIDFEVLTQKWENPNFLKDQDNFKAKFNFNNILSRHMNEYVLWDNISPDSYFDYLLELNKLNSMICCQMEQSIGLMKNNQLLMLFNTDSVLCYDMKSTIGQIEECFETYLKTEECFGKVEWLEYKGKLGGGYGHSTFCGYRENNHLKIYYHPKSLNVNRSAEGVFMNKFDLPKFKNKLSEVKKEIQEFYLAMKEYDPIKGSIFYEAFNLNFRKP